MIQPCENTFNAKAQRRQDARRFFPCVAALHLRYLQHRHISRRFLTQRAQRLAQRNAEADFFVASALQSIQIFSRREDFSGARTALSASPWWQERFARTRLSALLRLRLCRAVRTFASSAFNQGASQFACVILRHIRQSVAWRHQQHPGNLSGMAACKISGNSSAQ